MHPIPTGHRFAPRLLRLPGPYLPYMHLLTTSTWMQTRLAHLISSPLPRATKMTWTARPIPFDVPADTSLDACLFPRTLFPYRALLRSLCPWAVACANANAWPPFVVDTHANSTRMRNSNGAASPDRDLHSSGYRPIKGRKKFPPGPQRRDNHLFNLT
ncbi:hypothetical protein BS50DRAFT_396902 [Corynespora cassiicola Philippines]|uniref:Uncharacterized protein n=1 Tax=Corynespora cassiicola Philippines TaxID=1448308 RepID=A0A2T2NL03_CORCC|nr:hypothetical protein BS50DRAFT_396902 [Corynespora cassiicola Philippines]